MFIGVILAFKNEMRGVTFRFKQARFPTKQLRHFEELTNQEVAESLNIHANAASMRYVRAINRLTKILSNFETD